MPLVAGVDSSTQSTKIELRDADSGVLVASGRAPHPATTPPRSEQDPAAWWSAFASAWEACGAATADVAALSVGGQQHGMVALDAGGEVIRPAKLWNDTETAPDAGWLLKQRPADVWAAAVGSVPVAAFTITKLSWLHRSEPDAWARLAHVVLPHDWLTYRLTGRLVTDRGDASGTGYWSPAEGAYRWDLLAVIDKDRDWSAVVPTVLGPTEAAGTWGSVVVGPGTGDNMAAALGIGLRPGEAAISIGTSGTVYASATAPSADPSGAVAGFADATGGFLPLVCTLNATKVTEVVRRLLGLSYEELDALALATAPGARGVVLLPYLDGERTPNRPKASGVLSGFRSDVEREQIVRAAFEGVACSLLDGLDALGDVIAADAPLALVGGGARSAAYRQIVADLSGRPIVVPPGEEHVALGAAVQAAAVLHGRSIADVQAAWGLGAGGSGDARGLRCEPSLDAERAAEVRAAYGARRDREA